MELKNFTDVETDVTEVDESIDFSIDQESLGVLFKGFSDGLYSNKIGSIVREITSNCFDSHIEAGITRPVSIEMLAPDPYTGTPGNISFIDFGVGLSPDRIKNVYSKYFASTKRATNAQIGGFGIGAKSPLSYTDSFMAITRFEGIEYVYIIHRGVKVPQIELIEKNPTDKHNGTEVKIPIKNVNDFNTFKKEIKTQLTFFDNINFINCGMDNNYKLYQGKHFIVRWDKSFDKNSERNEPSICLGKVKYPIDWSQIGLQRYNYDSPIALRFDVGDLTVTMNRETIEYTPAVISRIQLKFSEAALELQMLADNSRETVSDFETYMELVKSTTPMIKIDKDVFVPVEGFAHVEPVKFAGFDGFPAKFKFPSSDPFFQFEVTGLIDGNGTLRGLQSKRRYVKDNLQSLIKDKATIYRVNGSLGKRKNLYLHSQYGDFYVIRKNPDEPYAPRVIGIHNESDPDKYAEIYSQVILKYLLEHTSSYDRAEVDETWMKTYIADLKSGNVIRDKSELYYRELRMNEYTSDAEFKADKEQFSDFVKSLKQGQMIVYGFIEDHEKLGTLGFVLSNLKSMSSRNGTELNSHAVRILKISRENAKLVSQIPGAIYVNDAFSKMHKHLSAIHLKNKFNNLMENGKAFTAYHEVLKRAFPRISALYLAVEEGCTSNVYASSAHGDKCRSAVKQFIETEGYHYTMQHVADNLTKLQQWMDRMSILQTLDYNAVHSMSKTKQIFLFESLKKLAKLNSKSILNY